MKRKRFEELDDGYDIVSPQIVGLGESKLIHGILGSPCFLMSSFMTTRSGLEYEKNSRRLICQLPLYGDITDPLTMVCIPVIMILTLTLFVAIQCRSRL